MMTVVSVLMARMKFFEREREIDLLAENELMGLHRVFVIECRKMLIDPDRVRGKFAAFVRTSGEWSRIQSDFVALSMDVM